MKKHYKVIHPYLSYDIRPPLLLPVGTILEWWEERGFYLSHAVNNTCVRVGKWAVEAWHEYFEKIEDDEKNGAIENPVPGIDDHDESDARDW